MIAFQLLDWILDFTAVTHIDPLNGLLLSELSLWLSGRLDISILE